MTTANPTMLVQRTIAMYGGPGGPSTISADYVLAVGIPDARCSTTGLLDIQHDLLRGLIQRPLHWRLGTPQHTSGLCAGCLENVG